MFTVSCTPGSKDNESRASIWSNSAELHTCYEARQFYLLLLFPISLTIALIFSAEVLYVIFSNKLKSSAKNSFSSKGPNILDRERKKLSVECPNNALFLSENKLIF